MKILISWLALQHDFIRDKESGALLGVNTEGTNYNMHKHFYNYGKHVILYSGLKDENGALRLISTLKKDFPAHELELINMDIHDPIDLSEIKPKVEARLMELSDHDMDLFVSPGTPAMYAAWYICHTTLNLKTRLIQTRPARFTIDKKPEFLTIEAEKSHTPVTSVIKETRLDKPETELTDYKITATLKPIYRIAELLAQNDRSTVIIFGETGTGKEHLARFIHDHSIRKSKPYVTVNCSAFNDQLLESRLFGYKRGSFTGADKDTPGKFEEAEGGTIFLDEIGDISPYMQQALLRVFQEKEIQPIGGKSKRVNVRVVSATNKNLVEMCKTGKFRLDLYYRLVVNELELPSLQDRGTAELDEMIDFFIKKKKSDLKRPTILRLTPDVRRFMHNYSWPGNIRELQNLIETLYTYCEREVTVGDIPSRFRESGKESSLNWKDVEKAHIEKVLKLKNGIQLQALHALGYGSINTLRNKIKEYNINVEAFEVKQNNQT